MSRFAVLLSVILCQAVYALPFNIVPKAGTTFPTTYNGAIPVTAYYTVSNNTTTTRNANYVNSLPPNVSQVTSNGTYSDTCGATFYLAPKGQPGSSCTLQLSIFGPVNGQDINPNNLTFICFPGGISCAGANPQLNIAVVSPWMPLSVSYEIAYIADVVDAPTAFVPTYKDGGSNPVTTDEEWDAYTPPPQYTKNSARYLQFNESVALGSPGEPLGTDTYIVTGGTPSGYTWVGLSNTISAMYPYNPSDYSPPANQSTFIAGNLTLTPAPGVVKVISNYKAQWMKFYANENDVPTGTPGAVPILRFFVTDPWGNEYIMHASAQSTPDAVLESFNAAVLPTGFTKEARYITEDIILKPASGPGNAYQYNLITDSQDNSYHQHQWGAQGIMLAQKIASSGMPTWGGMNTNPIQILKNYANLIYGGGGTHEYVFPTSLTADSVNTIADFNGPNGDTLNFEGQSYSYLITSQGIEILLHNGPSQGATIILSGVFYFDSNWVV